MTEHRDHHSDEPAHGHGHDGHGHGGHDHGPAIWRGLMSWLYPIVYRNPPSNRLIVEVADLATGDRVLDIGCGPGSAVRAAAPLAEEAVGADPSERMLRVARRRSRREKNVRYVRAPAHHLPFEADSFTIAWTVHSMHHWADELAGITEIRRVLTSDGRFLVMERFDPAKPWGVGDADIERITSLMRDAGFADVDVSRHQSGNHEEVVITGQG